MVRLSRLISLLVGTAMLIAACGMKGTGSQDSPSTPPFVQGTTQLQPAPTSYAPLTNLSTGLVGLDFDTFLEESYRRLLSRDPETVLELGLSDVFNVPTNQLTDISAEYIHQTQSLETDIVNLLRLYNHGSLTTEQQLNYDIYAWYLSDRVSGHAFMYDDYPLNPTVFSVHLDLLQFFTDLRPVDNLQDAQDYVTCLSQVKTKFEQLVDGSKRREDHGVILPRFLINWILGDINGIANSTPRSTLYFTAFETKLSTLDSLAEGDKKSLLLSAEGAINTSVIPAYQSLADYLETLQTHATFDAGVWKFPNGKDYYAYTLRHYTSTGLTAEQIHQMGMQALDRIHAEMRKLFDQLGYPQDESLPELFARVAQDSGMLSGAEILRGYEDIITAVDQNIADAFDLRPGIGVIVKGDPIGGYYNPPAVDGSRLGIFYAADAGTQPRFSMPTLAYHEGIPGHHYQIAIAQQLELPSIRKISEFTAYVEGWALYAEQLVGELGVYENDPYGDLGRLQAQAFRAARLVVDTGIHNSRWTFDQAVEFMVENTGMPEYMLQGEVSRYISLPGQATAYYIGYTKIVELRQRAMDALGDQFVLKEFHNLLLGSGAMPLDILEQVVDSYIQTGLTGG